MEFVNKENTGGYYLPCNQLTEEEKKILISAMNKNGYFLREEIMTDEKEFIFTFGVGDEVNAGCFVAINAPDEFSARIKMSLKYGSKWGFCYESREEAGVEKYNLKEIIFEGN